MPTLDTVRVKVNNSIAINKSVDIELLTQELISEFTNIPVKDLDKHTITKLPKDRDPDEQDLYYQLYTLFRPLIYDAIEAAEPDSSIKLIDY